MAAGEGAQLPATIAASRSVEKSVEEAAASGALNLSNRKLKEFPRTARNYDLSDITRAGDSPNRGSRSGRGLTSGEPQQQQHDSDKTCLQKSHSRSERLNKHKQRLIGEEPYSCDQCGKSFNHSGALITHQRIHTGEEPYSCDQCGKSFNHSGALITHQSIHTGEEPYSCDQCGKSFNHSGALITHQRIHTGEKPYSCLCGKIFPHSGPLKNHQKEQTLRLLSPAPVPDP